MLQMQVDNAFTSGAGSALGLISQPKIGACTHPAGQFDAQDGPGSVEAWTTGLDWPGKADFFLAKRHIWRMGQDLSSFLQDTSGTASNTSQDGSSIAEGILRLAQQADNGKLQPVAGYWKHHQSLTTVVLKDAGHMVPRDQPLAAQTMIETWVQHSLVH